MPPEPPPISAPPDAIARAAWLAVIIGPALAMIGYVFAISSFLGGIGIGATIVGFVILIARRDRHPPGEDHATKPSPVTFGRNGFQLQKFDCGYRLP